MSDQLKQATEQFTAEVSNAGITDTSSGILVGVDPAQENRPDSQQEEAPAEKVQGRFTEEDLERVRQQEKDKLYPQIETMREKLERLEKERQERADAEESARREAEEEARQREESETDVRDLLTKKEQEWAERFEQEKLAREEAFALLEREREYQELTEYRQQAIAAAQDEIVPQLVDLVVTGSKEEVDASIAGLKERSARILEDIAAATQTARRDKVGARVTAPSTGPMDTHQEQQQFTPQSIAEMSMNEYAKHRSRLLGENTRSRGMFG